MASFVSSCGFRAGRCTTFSPTCFPDAQLNIGVGSTGAFSIAADAAFNETLNPPFNPYLNDIFFIHGGFLFEDVGVTAYKVRLYV